MRLRITFAKTDAMRYTSHLDLHRTWERTMRRARLPLAYSLGFNPRPRLNLGSALPLGFTGQAEVIDIWLEQEVPLVTIESALQRALPPGLQIARLEQVDLRNPALQTEIDASEYVITLLEPAAGLEERLETLLAASSLPRQRRGKSYDLRPLIQALQALPPDEQNRQRILALLSAREGATGRPEEVLEALGIDAQTSRIHRTRLVFRENRI